MSRHPIETHWREVGLPEYFLGNGGTNEKLYALYEAIRRQPQCAQAPLDAAQEAKELRAILRYMEETNARRFDPSRVVTLIALVADRFEKIAAQGVGENIARRLAKWIGYKWDGLQVHSAVDRGFPEWPPSGGYQGGQLDLLRLADELSALSEGKPGGETYCSVDGRQWCEDRPEASRCDDCPVTRPEYSPIENKGDKKNG